jgi:hypothetical protein
MATTHATANASFEFTDPQGQQMSIPLSAAQFINGTLSDDGIQWTPFSNSSCDEQATAKRVTEER